MSAFPVSACPATTDPGSQDAPTSVDRSSLPPRQTTASTETSSRYVSHLPATRRFDNHHADQLTALRFSSLAQTATSLMAFLLFLNTAALTSATPPSTHPWTVMASSTSCLCVLETHIELMTPSTYLGSRIFNTGPFDPQLCATACTSQTSYNEAHPPSDGSAPKVCRFFNTYMLLENGQPLGQYCALYTASYDSTYASNFGQYDQQGNHYTIDDSSIYSSTSDPGFACF